MQKQPFFLPVFFLIALILGLAGCMGTAPLASSSGTPIDSAKVAQIVKGKTTRAELEALLGKPDQSQLLPDGRRMLAYNYSASETKMSNVMLPWNMKANIIMRNQSLQVFLTKDNIVEDYELSDNTRNTSGDPYGRSHTTTR